MTSRIALFATLSLIAGLSLAHADELIVCGWDEVFVIDADAPAPPAKLWSWRAADAAELPAAVRPKFRTTDDCKPVDGGRRVLITSSAGAVALVDRATRRVVCYAEAPNAHSADLLPGGRVAVAASTHAEGNRLIVFASGMPGRELASDPLHSAHGAVWDGARQLLWALGYDELRAYRIEEDAGGVQLARAAVHKLPDGGGHDLAAVPGTAELVLTTAQHVYRFNRENGVFAPYEPLADAGDVKCVSAHPKTGRVVYTIADRPEWWTDRLRFLAPEGTIRLQGERLYKARWGTQNTEY